VKEILKKRKLYLPARRRRLWPATTAPELLVLNEEDEVHLHVLQFFPEMFLERRESKMF